MTKKNFVCIFAHPDDEAFGPGGTIHQLTKEYDVYILCATKGQQGQDSDFEQEGKLHSRRAHELLDSAQILGVKQVHFLGFQDGCLCNKTYHKLADKIQEKLEELRPIGIMTFDQTGISGHIDHITVSLATTYVFQKLSFIKELWYHCWSQEKSKVLGKDYFIYFPEGYKKEDIGKVVDVSGVWDIVLAAMTCHKSQKHDMERILAKTKNFPKEECFIIRTK